MADGALERFGADVACSVTGIAGPDGGTEEKPVGYVCFCVKSAKGEMLPRDIVLPGGPRRHPRALGRRRDAPAALPARGQGAAAMSRPSTAVRASSRRSEIVDDLRDRLGAARLAASSRTSGWELGHGPRLRPASSASTGPTGLRLRPARAPERARQLAAGTGSTSSVSGPEAESRSCCCTGGRAARSSTRPRRGLLAAAGHDVIVPSLPGFAWSEPPVEPLNVAGDGGAPAGAARHGPGARPLRGGRRRLGRDHRRADGLRCSRARQLALRQHPGRAADAPAISRTRR